MYPNMHKKFLAVSISVVTAVIVIMLVLLNASVNGSIKTDQTELLDLILRCGGEARMVLTDPSAATGSEDLTQDTGWSDYANLLSANYFVVTTAGDSIMSVNISNCPEINDTQARILAQAAIGQGLESGNVGSYAYKELLGPLGSTYAFLNVSRDTLLLLRLLLTSLGVGALGLGLGLIAITVMATRMVRPAERYLAAARLTMEKSAAEAEAGAAFLTAAARDRGSAHAQEDRVEGDRLHGMAGELRAVAGAFERPGRPMELNLSTIFENEIRLFEESFREADANVYRSIEPETTLRISKVPIQKLLGLLLQNASENVIPGGDVFLDLVKGEDQVGIIVRFETEELPEIVPERLFVTDEMQEGKYLTVGLLAAKLIAKENGFDLRCEYLEPTSLCFTVRLKASRSFLGRLRAGR